MGMSETLKAISDPVRRDILNMLKEERKSAGEIAEKFNLTGATVSYHLSQLKKADLITETKYKNFIASRRDKIDEMKSRLESYFKTVEAYGYSYRIPKLLDEYNTNLKNI